MKGLTISQVAKASNVNIETVRYYEKRKLIQKPPRTKSGYRNFSPKVIKRIKFIKKAQKLYFTLEEIKKLLLIYENNNAFDSEEIRLFVFKKIKEIKEKICDFKKVKTALEELIEKCPDSRIPKSQCPFINYLEQLENNWKQC